MSQKKTINQTPLSEVHDAWNLLWYAAENGMKLDAKSWKKARQGAEALYTLLKTEQSNATQENNTIKPREITSALLNDFTKWTQESPLFTSSPHCEAFAQELREVINLAMVGLNPVPQTKINRDDGFYWVQRNNHPPEIADWSDSAWLLIGNEQYFDDNDMRVICGPLPVPLVGTDEALENDKLLAAAINFACDETQRRGKDGIEWLRLWREGDAESMTELSNWIRDNAG